ncbi:MAG: hypothetical protein IT326_06950, partial [Anaerolineae bacterium]|nr:hypothetical protein [Anaerolineae bacterium]
YRLPLERGQRIDLTAQALVAGLDLLFELYAPDGQLLTARDDNLGSDPALWNFMPSQSGTYTVVLSNYDEGIGDYALRVAPSTGAGEAVIGTRTEIGVQGSPRRSNWTTFEGRALDAVRIEARPLTPSVDIVMSLYDPYGNLLVSVNSFGVDAPEQMTSVQLPVSGTYQVEFATIGETGTLDYLIRPISQADLAIGGIVRPGRAGYEGEVVGPGTVIAFIFDGRAGELIGVDAHATGDTGLDLAFDLFAPDGYPLISRDDVVGQNPVLDRIELPVEGRYVVLLRNISVTTGPFDVFITNPEAPGMPTETP